MEKKLIASAELSVVFYKDNHLWVVKSAEAYGADANPVKEYFNCYPQAVLNAVTLDYTGLDFSTPVGAIFTLEVYMADSTSFKVNVQDIMRAQQRQDGSVGICR